MGSKTAQILIRHFPSFLLKAIPQSIIIAIQDVWWFWLETRDYNPQFLLTHCEKNQFDQNTVTFGEIFMIDILRLVSICPKLYSIPNILRATTGCFGPLPSCIPDICQKCINSWQTEQKAAFFAFIWIFLHSAENFTLMALLALLTNTRYIPLRNILHTQY